MRFLVERGEGMRKRNQREVVKAGITATGDLRGNLLRPSRRIGKQLSRPADVENCRSLLASVCMVVQFSPAMLVIPEMGVEAVED